MPPVVGHNRDRLARPLKTSQGERRGDDQNIGAATETVVALMRWDSSLLDPIRKLLAWPP